MKTEPAIHTFFDHSLHLNENGTALTAEAFFLDRTAELPNEISEHLEQCDRCKVQVLGLLELLKEQPIDRNIHHPYFDRRPVILPFPNFLKAAAVITAILAGGAAYILFTSNGTSGNDTPYHSIGPVTTSPDTFSDPVPENERVLADHFAPSPNLDDLVRSDFRSESIEVLSPENDAIVSSPITFRWKQYQGPVILKILNNREMTVQMSNVKENRFVTTKSLVPGLYYWKLEDEGELLYIGKFFVK